MEKPAALCRISEFPLCPEAQKVLLYYTVRSRRVTVVCFGMRYILLYCDERQIKTFRLPEQVTCATIVNVPSPKKAKNSVLICGSSQGSVFALLLPSSKEELSIFKKRNSEPSFQDAKKESVLVYKYIGLKIHCLMCTDGHLLVVGNEEKIEKLFLFHPCVLHKALEHLDCGQDIRLEPDAGYESVSIRPPSIACSTSIESPNVILFRWSESHSSFYFVSLDCVQNLDKELGKALFGTDISAPVVCFLYPNGESWYRAIGYDGQLSKPELNKFACLQEPCAAVVKVWLGPEFFVKHTEIKREVSTSKMGLMLLGTNKGVSILFEREIVEYCGTNFETVYLPYSAGVKSFVSKWDNLVPCHEVFLNNMSNFVSGVNAAGSCTNFTSEQYIVGIKSDTIWALQDLEEHTSLVSVRFSDLWAEHTFSSSSLDDSIKNLLTELEELNFQNKEVKAQSDQMTSILKELNVLTMRVIDKNLDFLHVEISHSLVRFSDSRRLCVNLAVSNTDKDSVLRPFLYNLQVSVKCLSAPVGSTHAFDFQNFNLGCTEKLCVTVEEEELKFGKTVAVNVFLNIFGMETSESLPEDVKLLVNSGFPVIIPFLAQKFDVCLV